MPLHRWLIVLVLVPFVASALALVFGVGSSFIPVSDIALGELLVRDIGRHPLYQGLYSRDGWSHPGPILYILLAPFYWATGGSSIGLAVGALAINGSSVVGMGLVARRRAGTGAMVATFLAASLMMRTLGAELWHDSWNCSVTVMPFALLAFLVWALLDGDRWALPVAVFVATFLAQTHVGYVALAVPLLGIGVIGLGVEAWRSDASDRWSVLRRPVSAAVIVGAVVWLPPLIDLVDGPPRNLVEIGRWFRTAEGGVGTVGEGVKVMTGQFGLIPEWATVRRPVGFSGETRYLDHPVVPWVLVAVVAAAAVVWRRVPTGRRLVVVLAATFLLGIAAVARTVGPHWEYRLLWTWVPPVIAFVVVSMAARTWVEGRSPVAARRLRWSAIVALVLLTGVNTVTAARAGSPDEGDSDVMTAITPPVVEAVEDLEGPVLITDPYYSGTWYARGLVLQLERRGIDAVVPPERAGEESEHRVHRGGPVATTLIVVRDEVVATLRDDPELELLVEWTAVGPERLDDLQEGLATVDADLAAGRIDPGRAALRSRAQLRSVLDVVGAMAYRVAVFRRR